MIPSSCRRRGGDCTVSPSDAARGTTAEFVLSLYEVDVGTAQRAYADLHARCPVAFNAAHGGHWLLAGYEAVRRAAKDWATFSSAFGVDIPDRSMPEGLIASDPPAHTEYRRIDRQAINPETVEAIRPYVLDLAGQLMDRVPKEGPVDFVSAFADEIPPATIARIVGLDPGLAGEMRAVSIKVGSSFGDDAAFAEAMAEFRAFVIPQVELRRREPREDFLTLIATQPIRGAKYTDEQILSAMIGFLLAGHESTTAAFTSTLFRLLADPRRWAAVGDNRDLLARAVEEALRLDSPFHQFRRRATCPVDLDGASIAAGDDVALNYAAANRDPARFPDPDEFVIDRRPNPHVAFGYGVHACLGAPLARMELNTALGVLVERFPQMRLAVDPATVSWEFRGGGLAYIPHLPVLPHGH